METLHHSKAVAAAAAAAKEKKTNKIKIKPRWFYCVD
jgi:hypothetical protein